MTQDTAEATPRKTRTKKPSTTVKKTQKKTVPNNTTLIVTHVAIKELTLYFMRCAGNADTFLRERYKKVWVTAAQKYTNMETRCIRYTWTGLTPVEKGLIQACLLTIPFEEFVYTDPVTKELFGGLPADKHGIK